MPAPLRILLIEDNPGDARLIEAAVAGFRRLRAEVLWRSSLDDAAADLAAGEHDVVLADLSLPGSEGMDTVTALARPGAAAPLIVLTGLDDDELAEQALHAGAQDYLVKRGLPDPDQLERALRHALERQQLLRQVVQLTLTDPLTGLANRRGFREHLAPTLALARRQERPLLLFCADLDGLKRINDTHGHAAGDEALCRAATILRTTFRESDVLARLGGDEFAMVPLEGGPEDAEVLGARLDQTQDEQGDDGEHPWRVRLSWGTATIRPGGEEQLEAALRAADEALYRRKRG